MYEVHAAAGFDASFDSRSIGDDTGRLIGYRVVVASVDPSIPQEVAHVVDKALALDMDARWGDAAAMRDALRAARDSIGASALADFEPPRGISAAPDSTVPSVAKSDPLASHAGLTPPVSSTPSEPAPPVETQMESTLRIAHVPRSTAPAAAPSHDDTATIHGTATAPPPSVNHPTASPHVLAEGPRVSVSRRVPGLVMVGSFLVALAFAVVAILTFRRFDGSRVAHEPPAVESVALRPLLPDAPAEPSARTELPAPLPPSTPVVDEAVLAAVASSSEAPARTSAASPSAVSLSEGSHPIVSPSARRPQRIEATRDSEVAPTPSALSAAMAAAAASPPPADQARAIMLANPQGAKSLLMPLLTSGKATREEASLLRVICKNLKEPRCLDACNAYIAVHNDEQIH